MIVTRKPTPVQLVFRALADQTRLRILRATGLRIWRESAYLRDGLLKVGEKVQIAGTIGQEGTGHTYTAKLIKVVQ